MVQIGHLGYQTQRNLTAAVATVAVAAAAVVPARSPLGTQVTSFHVKYIVVTMDGSGVIDVSVKISPLPVVDTVT
jgi:hypothetical protein